MTLGVACGMFDGGGWVIVPTLPWNCVGFPYLFLIPSGWLMVGRVELLGGTIVFWTFTGILISLLSIPFGWWMVGRVWLLGGWIKFSERLSVLDCNPPPHIYSVWMFQDFQ